MKCMHALSTLQKELVIIVAFYFYYRVPFEIATKQSENTLKLNLLPPTRMQLDLASILDGSITGVLFGATCISKEH